MKRWLKMGLVVALGFSLIVGVLGTNVASAKSPKPQDQVKNFMNAAAGLKAGKAAGYWVIEQRSDVTSQLGGVPSGTKISLSKLKLVVTSQTADTAIVTATYIIKIKPKGSKKTQQSNLSDTFTLKMVGATWLISDSSMLEHVAGLVTPTATATPTASATATVPPTATTAATTPNLPVVKIGVIGPWSGPMSMAGVLYDKVINLVEDQVKNTGGILGGRDVKFIRSDDRGIVAESAAQAKKLILEDKITILTWGGISAACFNAVSDVAEQYKVPYVGLGLMSGLAAKKYTAQLISYEVGISASADIIINYLKPKTVAILAYDASDMHDQMNGKEGVVGLRERLESVGMHIVYEQYFPQDTMDLSPYITKIKYENPDLLFVYLNDVGQAVMINKEIMGQGGWGSIKFLSGTEPYTAPAAIKISSAVGTYSFLRWMAGSDEPGMKGFEDAYKQKYGKLPDYNQAYAYTDFWTAVKAIELAGTDDPVKVAEALRSGNLEWDSAWGPLRMDSNGSGVFNNQVVQIQEGGKLVSVWPK